MPNLLHVIFLTLKLESAPFIFRVCLWVATVCGQSKISLKKRNVEQTAGEGLKQKVFQLGSHITYGTPHSTVLQSIFLNLALP